MAAALAAGPGAVISHSAAATIHRVHLYHPSHGLGHPYGQLEQRVLRVLKGLLPPPLLHHLIELDDQLIDMDLCWPDTRLDGDIDGLGEHPQRSDCYPPARRPRSPPR